MCALGCIVFLAFLQFGFGVAFLVGTPIRMTLFDDPLGQRWDEEAPAQHQIALVSHHEGTKFWGLRSRLVRNKQQFCRMGRLACFIDTSVLPSRNAADDLKNQDRYKYILLLSILDANRATVGAIWIDGATWLFGPERRDFDNLLALVPGNDIVIGRDRNFTGDRGFRQLPKDISGVCSGGVNSNVFWVRRSAWTMEWLRVMAERQGNWSDQCIVNRFYIDDVDSFRDHVLILPTAQTRFLQCRARCTVRALCCTHDSWLVSWPAHDGKDLLMRIWAREIGLDTQPVLSWLDRLVCVLPTSLSSLIAECREAIGKPSIVDFMLAAVVIAMGSEIAWRCANRCPRCLHGAVGKLSENAVEEPFSYRG